MRTYTPVQTPLTTSGQFRHGSLGVGASGARCSKVATPACAQARPSAPAISAGRSGRTRTPLPAAQRPAKVTPAPPVGSQTPAQPGADLPYGRAGGRPEGSGQFPHSSPYTHRSASCSALQAATADRCRGPRRPGGSGSSGLPLSLQTRPGERKKKKE